MQRNFSSNLLDLPKVRWERWDHGWIHQKPGICWKMIDRKWLNTEWALAHKHICIRYMSDELTIRNFHAQFFEQCWWYVYELPQKIIIEWNEFHSQSISQVCILKVPGISTFSDFIFCNIFYLLLFLFLILRFCCYFFFALQILTFIPSCVHSQHEFVRKCVNNFVHWS